MGRALEENSIPITVECYLGTLAGLVWSVRRCRSHQGQHHLEEQQSPQQLTWKVNSEYSQPQTRLQVLHGFILASVAAWSLETGDGELSKKLNEVIV